MIEKDIRIFHKVYEDYQKITVLKYKTLDTEKFFLASLQENIPPIKYSQKIVVETERGLELVKAIKILTAEKRLVKNDIKGKFIKVADSQDLEKYRENEKYCEQAYKIAKKLIKKHNLPMKLIHVYMTLNGERIIFYFTSPTRVDFRELVKDLAKTFKRRIELRQIGVRDAVKILGALGPCGRECCCKYFLEHFKSITLDIVKKQGLSLNPIKISGICGRLLCCFAFEDKNYFIKTFLPEVGEEVNIDGKKYILKYIDIVKEELVLIDENEKTITYPIKKFVGDEIWERYKNHCRPSRYSSIIERDELNQEREEFEYN
jgi:cell fate regulator YaaT (PSP1 superfamily)